jgi:hypothetical protein
MSGVARRQLLLEDSLADASGELRLLHDKLDDAGRLLAAQFVDDRQSQDVLTEW